jgi:alpha-2-macroglobulin
VASLPSQVRITHVGSGTEFKLPLQWPGGANAARSALSQWAIPKTAALGLYDVALLGGGAKRGELAAGSFRVEAFRVPLVDARLTVTNSQTGAIVAPADLVFNAQIQAMAGGPMVAAPLKLSALLRAASVQFVGYEDFSFEAPAPVEPGAATPSLAGQEEASSPDNGRLVADKLTASTDKSGAAQIKVASLPKLNGPSDLLAELTFNDPNGEVQTVSQTLRLWPAGVVVGLRAPGWAAAKGEAGVTVVVLDTQGQPLAGRSVEVRGQIKQTYSTRKRIVGGFYAYDNRQELRDLGRLCSGKTDPQGRLPCSAKLDAVGEVQLTARSPDDAGRVALATTSVWLSGAGEWWFAQNNDDRIDVLPEKRDVAPGDVARLQVRMPFRQATALVTVEREGVIDARVMQLSGREPVIELPIPKRLKDTNDRNDRNDRNDPNSAAKNNWAPNVVVSVLVLRGRLRDAPWWSAFTWGWREPGEWWRAFRFEGQDYRAPSAMVDLAKPAFKLGVTQLNVGLAEQQLDVQVQTNKAQYAPREIAKATVRVTHQGRPLAGVELAFAAVDEGLLALQNNGSWNLLQGLMQPRPWGVETATAQSEIIGRRHYGRKALPPGGGGGRNPTRELFDTLLLWQGRVLLDANGQAVIDVPLNDSLTSFKLVAIADAHSSTDGNKDDGEKFGTGSTSVRVTQDLQMLSGLSPLAREGDRFDAGFTLRNTTARSMAVSAKLGGRVVIGDGAAGSGKTLELPPQTLTLAAGAATEVRWPVDVPAGATRIDWEGAVQETATAAGVGASGGAVVPATDRLKISQAVQAAVPVQVWQASLQALEGNFQMPVAPPADALPGAGGVQFSVQPRLTGALPGLRRFFANYPYSCLEQKTSRAIGLRDGPAWDQLRGELASYLDADGLAHYFPPSAGSAPRGSDKLTAYLIAAAHEARYAWPDAQRERMLAGLAAFVEGRIERRFQSPRADLDMRKLAALEALSRHGRVQPRMLGSISFAPAAWPTSTLLDAWGLYRRVENLPNRGARLDELQRLIRSRLVAGGTTLKFSTEASDDWWWLMEGTDANAARLLLAATDAPAWKDELPQILTGTLARQQRGAWATTTANLWGVLALERFAAKFESVVVAGKSTVQLGNTTRQHDWQAAPEGGAQSLPWPVVPVVPVVQVVPVAPAASSSSAAVTSGAALQARHDGAGRPWLTVQTLAAVPLRAPLFAGYRVTRSLSAVERKTPGLWTRGDVMRVRLEVEALADMSWVVFSDPVPAGATILGGGLGRDSAIATSRPSAGEKRDDFSWPVYEERALDAWRGYYEWLPRGKHIVEYTLRLNASGRFVLPPTRVEAMYAPESFAQSPNVPFDVRP